MSVNLILSPGFDELKLVGHQLFFSIQLQQTVFEGRGVFFYRGLPARMNGAQ